MDKQVYSEQCTVYSGMQLTVNCKQ